MHTTGRGLGGGVAYRSGHTPQTSRRRWFHPHLEALENRCLLSVVPGSEHLFYENSFYDGNTAGVNPTDDSAVAPKTAYLPTGAASTFDNVSSYWRGINGLTLDFSGPHGTITTDDFTFKVGNNNTTGNWTAPADPIALTVRGNAGGPGVDRVEIIWSDNAIQKKWLEVIVAANADTGLSRSHVFFFGSAVGDSGAADAGAYSVNSSDEISARNDPHGVGNFADISNVNDFNRDRLVNSSDQIIARTNVTDLSTQVKILNVTLAVPTLTAALANDTGPDGTPNSDGITTDVTVSGTLTDAYTVTSFKAGLNGGPVTTDAMSLLQPNGTFTLSPSFITAMNGGSLPDGPYTLRLESLDAQGLGTSTVVTFTKKTTIGPAQAPDLVASSDSGESPVDNITNDNTPTFAVTAETGSLVKLLVDNVVVAQGTAAPGLQLTASALGNGQRVVKITSQDGAGNLATSSTLTITVSTVAPTITAKTLMAFTDDLTPHVTVTASDPLGLSNSTQVFFDVDLNFDGDYGDPGELSRTNAVLYNGQAYFQVSPGIPAPAGGMGNVQYRARITDVAGNEGASPELPLRIDVLSNTFLSTYVNSTSDPYYYDATPDSQNIVHSTAPTTIPNTVGYTATVYDLRSQEWRTTADVNRTQWQHWVTVIVPTGNLSQLSPTALLLINGGNNNDARPTSANSNLVTIATTLNVVVIELRIVPNQSLTFTADPSHQARTEDQIIAFTFDQYLQQMGVGPDWTTWPALLPMVKSAKRTMDMVQAVDTGITSGAALPGGREISDFVVTGYSKRGWTTWLTAAVDNRIKAIVPGVIDVLNMDEQMIHHHDFFQGNGAFTVDGFSIAVQDYVGYGIPENVQKAKNQELGRVVDPYRYLNNGHFNIPKLIINASQDEYFVPDSSSFYFSDLPGTQNYLRYIPNNGHGLDSTETTNSTASFMNAVIKNLALPQYSWTVDPNGQIRVVAQNLAGVAPTVKLWQATNGAARDFRKTFNPSISYAPSNPGSAFLTSLGSGVFVTNVPTPGTGATAFFVEMTWTSPLSGKPYIFTTEIRVASNIPTEVWPFYTEPYGSLAGGGSTPGPGGGGDPPEASSAAAEGGDEPGADMNPLASSLSAPVSTSAAPAGAPAPLSPSGGTSGVAADPVSSLEDWSYLDDAMSDDEGSAEVDPGTVDLALATLDADDLG
jgi:PhoPQ-activated pathogenicity-related protein